MQVELNSVLARMQQHLEEEVPLSSLACGRWLEAAAPAVGSGNCQPAAAGRPHTEAAAGMEVRHESPAAQPKAGLGSAAAVVLKPCPGTGQPQVEVKAGSGLKAGPSAPLQPLHEPAAAAAVRVGSQGAEAEAHPEVALAELRSAAETGPEAAPALEIDTEATQPQTQAPHGAGLGPEARAAQAPTGPSASSSHVPIPLGADEQVRE